MRLLLEYSVKEHTFMNRYTLRCTCTNSNNKTQPETSFLLNSNFLSFFFITFQNDTKWVLRFIWKKHNTYTKKFTKRDSMHVDTLLFHIICNNEHTPKKIREISVLRDY